MFVVGRRQQQSGRVGGAAGDDHDPGPVGLDSAVLLDDHLGDGGAGRVGAQLHGPRVRHQRDVGELHRRSDRDRLRVGLGVHQAGESVAVHAANAGGEGRLALVEQDAARRMKRLVAGAHQIVVKLLDARLVRDGRVRIRAAGGRIDRVLAARAVNLIEVLRAHVVGLQVGVGDRPGRRQAVVVPELAEVALAQAVERGAVHLGRAADEVVDARLERLAVLVEPGLLGDVAVVDEDVGGAPVLLLARQPPAALEQENVLAGRPPARAPACRPRRRCR